MWPTTNGFVQQKETKGKEMLNYEIKGDGFGVLFSGKGELNQVDGRLALL
jgi:hypothetical protein